jgi:hypothetical protein
MRQAHGLLPALMVVVSCGSGTPTDLAMTSPTSSGAPTAAQLMAKMSTCNQTSNGLFKTDSELSRTIPVCKGSGAFWWKADMDIDCDGVTTAKCNKSTDPSYQNGTSLQTSGGQAFDAASVPYVVIPSANSTWSYAANGIALGAVVAVIYNGKITYGVFADTGPTDIIGEASYAMAVSLGIDPDPAIGGTDGPVWYLVFPGSKVAPAESHADAVNKGEALVRAYFDNN